MADERRVLCACGGLFRAGGAPHRSRKRKGSQERCPARAVVCRSCRRSSVPHRRGHPYVSSRLAQGRRRNYIRCGALFSDVRVDASVYADVVSYLVLPSVRGRYAHAEHFKRRHVRAGRDLQHASDSKARRLRCGPWDDACLRGREPSDAIFLLREKRPALPAPGGAEI